MSNQTSAKNRIKKRKKSNFPFVNKINIYIDSQQKNSLGISLMYIMVGSGMASLTAALSVQGVVSMPILAICTCLAMGTNASILSQQTFKFSSWFFIVNIIANTFLLIYQIAILF